MAEISQAMRSNPDMMRQMGESLGNMSQEQLDSMTAMSGMPGRLEQLHYLYCLGQAPLEAWQGVMCKTSMTATSSRQKACM